MWYSLFYAWLISLSTIYSLLIQVIAFARNAFFQRQTRIPLSVASMFWKLSNVTMKSTLHVYPLHSFSYQWSLGCSHLHCLLNANLDKSSCHGHSSISRGILSMISFSGPSLSLVSVWLTNTEEVVLTHGFWKIVVLRKVLGHSLSSLKKYPSQINWYFTWFLSKLGCLGKEIKNWGLPSRSGHKYLCNCALGCGYHLVDRPLLGLVASKPKNISCFSLSHITQMRCPVTTYDQIMWTSLCGFAIFKTPLFSGLTSWTSIRFFFSIH